MSLVRHPPGEYYKQIRYNLKRFGSFFYFLIDEHKYLNEKIHQIEINKEAVKKISNLKKKIIENKLHDYMITYGNHKFNHT